MANSSDVVAGTAITAAAYNNLRADVLNTTTGHTHNGTDGIKLTDAALNYDRWKVIVYEATATNYIWIIPTTGTKQFRISIFGKGEYLDNSNNVSSQSTFDFIADTAVNPIGGTGLYTRNSFGGYTSSSSGHQVIAYLNNNTNIFNWHGVFKSSSMPAIWDSIVMSFTAIKIKFTGLNLIIEELIEA